MQNACAAAKAHAIDSNSRDIDVSFGNTMSMV